MRLPSICLMLLLALLAGSARADGEADTAEAKRLFHSATTLYNLGEYDQALAQFKAAYKLKSDPAFLFNIAQCQRQLADYVAAEKSYRAFLREMPDAPQKVRDEVGRLVDEMAAAAKEQRANQPPTGVRAPDGDNKPAGAEPTPPTPQTQVQTALPPETHADLTARAPERKPITKKAWFWATVAAGAVVVAGAVTLGVVLGTRPQALPRIGTVEGN